MRKLKLFLSCLLMAVLSIGQVWAETVDFSSGNGTNNSTAKTNTWTFANYTIVQAKGASTATDPSASYLTSPRWYKGNTVTITPAANVTITEVVMTGTAANYNGQTMTFNIGSGSISSNTTTWSGTATNAAPLVITLGKQLRVSSVSITYSTGGSTACATPTFSPAAGAVLSGTEVSISCATEGATVHYTLDESEPTASSATAQPISITSATTIKAIAVKDGMNNSSVASASYTIATPLATMEDIQAAAESTEKGINIAITDWVVTAVSGNQVWIADADNAKGILLYMKGHGFAVDNKLNGTVLGTKIKLYQGYAELTSLVSTDVTVTTADEITPRTTTIAALTSGHPAEQGTIVKLENVTYSGSAFTDGSNSITIDTRFYAPTLVSGTKYNLSGVVYYGNNGVVKIMPRKEADVEAQSIIVIPTAANLAALKAAERGTYILTLTNAVVTYVNGNNAFIEDATAGALIYFSNHGYNAGDCLNGDYQVNTTDYQGKFEITSIEPQAGAATTTAEIPLTTVSIATLNADFAAYESMRIKIEGADVTDGISGTDRNGVIADGAELAVYASVTNTITLAEGKVVNIIGYPGFHNTDQQLNVWEQEDIEDVTPAPKYTVRFWNSENWDNVKAHVWNNNGAITSWPGEDAQLGDDGWNYYEIEEGNSLLFNNGNGTQTVDITNVTADACYVLTGSADGQGHKYVEADCSDRFYIAGNTALTGENWNAAGKRLENGSFTFYNVAASKDLEFKITNGTWKWNRGYLAFDGDCSNVENKGADNVFFATDAAKDITISYDKVNDKICVTLADPAAPDDRYKAEQTGFTATSGKLATVTEGDHFNKEYISYEAKKGDAATPPAINSGNIRLYQNGGLLVIGAAKGCKIDQVFLTTGSTYASTTIGYSKTETAIAQTGDEVAASTEWHTATGQDADTIVIVCLGEDKYSRIDVAKLDVRYTGDPTAVHHYKLAGEYAVEFNQGDAFNHDNLIVYASYDEQEQDLVDITAECTFSNPDMNQAGQQLIEITYNSAVVASYTITINETSAATLRFFAPVEWGDNVYAFTWADQYSGDHLMTAVEEGSRWFECELKKNVSFLIYKGNQDWSGQTVDFEGGINGNKCYTWAPKDGSGKYTYAEVASCEMNYYLTGENLPEITWDADSKALTNNEVVFENLAEGTYRFQITNGTWNWSLGFAYADQQNSNITLADNNGDVQFATTAAMNVTIAYNPATEKITVNGVLPPKPFEPNIKFGNAGTKINATNVNGTDSYNNTWNVVTVPGAAGQSFSQNAEYSQVGSSNKPAESITFSATLATGDEIAAVSYIAIKLGGFNNTAGTVRIKVDEDIYEIGYLDGTNDVVIATTNPDPMMGREITIEIAEISKGVKCYGIEYAYQVYEFVELKFFAPRDETNKWDDVYAYAYDANNTPYVGWPGKKLTEKDAEWYVYNAPKGYNVYFHDYAGMQTEAIENVQEAACYVPTAIDYSANPKKVTLAEQCTIDYYVAGDEGFTGNNWDPANATCKFDENNQVVFHDVPAGSYQFKITNGTWAWSIGGNDFLSDEPGCGSIAYTGDLGNTCFKIDEVQDVTITYYPATRKICLGAITVKTTGELTAYDIDNLYVDELKYPSYNTNITDYTAADVELTFVSGDACVEFVEGQIKGTAEGTAVVKVTIAETALFTGAEATFNVTVSAVPVPPTPQYETVRGGLEANRYYTLCFNRTMEAVQGATFWKFASKDANMAYLVQEDAPYAAGKPYIIYAEQAGDLNAVLSGEEEPNAGSNGALHGTFENLGQADLDGKGDNIYLLMNNELRRVDGQSNNNLPAYRAYIDMDEIANSGAPANVPAHRVRAIPMRTDVATGIDALNASEKPMKLMIDGNIYILRGEKMYNINGQLVK